MKSDLLCLHFSVFDLYFVTTQNNGNILANSCQISVPIWNTLVRDTGSHIKHNNGALTLNIVSVTKPTKLLLPSCVPYNKLDRPAIRVKLKWIYHYALGCDISLLKFSCKMSLHVSCLS